MPENIVIGQQFAQSPTGAVIPVPIGRKAKATHTVLGANQVWQSDIHWYNGNNSIQLDIQSDVSGVYMIEYYNLDGTKIPFMGNPTVFDPILTPAFQAGIAGKADGVKIIYTNGSVAQTTFYCEISLLTDNVQETLRSMGTAMSGTNLGGTVHAALEGREIATGGAFKQVTGSTIGNKFGIDVNIVNGLENQNVTILNPTTVPSTFTISNFPTTQPISGSVTANVTFPTVQAVSLSTIPLATGASTSVLQITGNTSLASIDNKLTSPLSFSFSTVGKTSVLKTGTITTSSINADQVVLTYTVTTGKTLYLQSVDMSAQPSTLIGALLTPLVMGSASLEIVSGTKVWTQRFASTASIAIPYFSFSLGEAIPISAGTVVRIVCTPSSISNIIWVSNLIAYER